MACQRKGGAQRRSHRLTLSCLEPKFAVLVPDASTCRATAALILGTPARTDWKACAKADDEEAADCQAFKKAFARYDPSG